MTHISVVIGTARPENFSAKVAAFIASQAGALEDITVDVVDVADFLVGQSAGAGPDMAKKWQAIVNNSDAFLFVVPEYNHSYPGELKSLLDLAYKEYNYKPVAVAGVSSGDFGGTRVVEHMHVLWPVFKMPYVGSLYVAKVKELFGEANNNPAESDLPRRSQEILTTLSVYAAAMKGVKETLAP